MLRWCALAAVLVATPLAAQDAAMSAGKGRLMTLMLGRYECERPAPWGESRGVPEPGASFAVTSASRYVGPDGVKGTYLYTGDMITMTSGALAGTRLVRVRDTFLRRIEPDGSRGSVRCVLARSSDKH